MNQIALYRIKAIILRNFLRYRHNAMTFVDIIFWPTLDIVVWGTTSIWFAKNASNINNIALAIMTGLVFWEMTLRAIYEISVGMINEIHERSLLTIFTTPLTLTEWIASTIITSMIRALVSALFCSSIIFIFYTTNVFSIGWMFIPFALSLIVSGWAIGFLGAGFIIYFGNKVQGMPWMLPWFAAPFSAIYYPLDALPTWMKYIGLCLPTSYIFQGMRSILFSNHMPWNLLTISLVLNIIYLAGAIFFFVYMFKKSKAKGLARL